MRTTGPAERLELSADRAVLKADGSDLVFVMLTAVDRDGRRVPTVGNPVRFSVTGPGTIAAVGNGDPTDRGSFQSDQCKVFHGQCLVMLRSTEGGEGQVVLAAESESFQGVIVRMSADHTQ